MVLVVAPTAPLAPVLLQVGACVTPVTLLVSQEEVPGTGAVMAPARPQAPTPAVAWPTPVAMSPAPVALPTESLHQLPLPQDSVAPALLQLSPVAHPGLGPATAVGQEGMLVVVPLSRAVRSTVPVDLQIIAVALVLGQTATTPPLTISGAATAQTEVPTIPPVQQLSPLDAPQSLLAVMLLLPP